MNKLDISEINIFPVKPKRGLIAFCSFVVNSQFYIGDVAIYTRPNGVDFRLVYPARQLANGKTTCCVHPIDRKTGDYVTTEVIKKYTEFVNTMWRESDDRRVER